MSRRRSARRPRRVSIQFWKQGDSHPYPGFTTNISMTGMFIGTRSPLPSGTRVRIEVQVERGFMIEGVVAHARKTRGELAQIAQSGMGVRFLAVEELVAEVLPGVGGGAGEAVPPPRASYEPELELETDRFEDLPDLPAPPAAGSEPAPPVAPTPASQASLGSPVRPSAPVLDPGMFTVHFPSPRNFVDIFERDIKNGGLFVSTRFPGRLGEVVTIELHPPDAEPIVVRARVVQRFEPNGASMLAGMGVELQEAQVLYERLRPIAARLARLAVG
jgi:Tfp pilus assembly protein PilZ